MQAEGPDDPTVLVIGEAPGKDEDRLGRPFVGASGDLLRPAMADLGDGAVAYTNIVRCRPMDKQNPSKREINYCSQFAFDDIRRYDPAIVLLLGNAPLGGILAESGITSWHGVVVEKDGRKFVPLFHPAHVLRNMSLLDEWLSTLYDALSGVSEHSKEKFERTIPRTFEQVLLMEERLATSEYIAFDVETHKKDPFHPDNKILSVSFAMDGYSWSLPIYHKDTWWSTQPPSAKGYGKFKPTELERVVGVVLGILQSHDGKIIGHNIKFDQLQILATMGCWFRIGGDTMLQSHLYDSRKGIHGLKRLAGIHLGMYEYEQELTLYKRDNKDADPNRGGSYDNIPLDILLPYGAMDSEAVWQLHPFFEERLSDKQHILYNQLILPASDMLARMQAAGMTIDEWLAKRYLAIYEIVQKELMDSILQDKYVKKMTADMLASSKYRKGYEFNPGSWMQKSLLYYNYCKIPTKDIPKSEKGNPTTSAKTLRVMENKYPLLKQIRLYNLLGKVMGTYLRPAATGAWLGGDGKARTNFNLHGTISGRLSSSEPFNSQNIPTPEKEPGTLLATMPIKNIFTHSYIHIGGNTYEIRYRDGVVMSCDYSGMELRVFASLANCVKMLDIIRSGKDVHSCVAIMSMTHMPVDDITTGMIKKLPKPVRYVYKWTNWTLLYGGDEYTLHHLYDVPLDEAKKTVSMYYDLFPEVLDFQKYCVEFAEDNGYIESVFGRKAYLPYINDDKDIKQRNHARREAMNIPVQGPASDTVLVAGVILDDLLEEGGFESRLNNTVHDSLALNVPIREVKPVAALCKDVMENVAVYAAKYMPDIDFTWLKSPLKADVDVGSHYGSVRDIDDWLKERAL